MIIRSREMGRPWMNSAFTFKGKVAARYKGRIKQQMFVLEGRQMRYSLLVGILFSSSNAWMCPARQTTKSGGHGGLTALAKSYLENDLVTIQKSDGSLSPRLCVVRPDSTVAPLCQHEDDVETDLFLDPRCDRDLFWSEATDDTVRSAYGEGWYGQRPVPSLGGGPGYGAQAQEIWSIDVETLEQLGAAGVELPILDVGIAHGERARGGAF